LIESQYIASEINLSGQWGNVFLYEDTPGLLFPVQDGWTTSITLTVSRLEIGLLDATGQNALRSTSVSFYCQSSDIAGNKTPDANCDSDENYTDHTGLTTFYTGPGIYLIEIFKSGRGYTSYYDIQISTGEERRLIINVP